MRQRRAVLSQRRFGTFNDTATTSLLKIQSLGNTYQHCIRIAHCPCSIEYWNQNKSNTLSHSLAYPRGSTWLADKSNTLKGIDNACPQKHLKVSLKEPVVFHESTAAIFFFWNSHVGQLLGMSRLKRFISFFVLASTLKAKGGGGLTTEGEDGSIHPRASWPWALFFLLFELTVYTFRVTASAREGTWWHPTAAAVTTQFTVLKSVNGRGRWLLGAAISVYNIFAEIRGNNF